MDPLEQARVVGRGGSRDLEASVHDAPLLENPSAFDHVGGGCGQLYAGRKSTRSSVWLAMAGPPERGRYPSFVAN